MKKRTTGRARLRSVLLAGVGLSMTLTGVLGGAGTAQARTEWRQMSHVWFDLSEYGPSGDERIRYSAFLASLRAAVAGYNTQETQLEDVGLVQVSLTALDDRGQRRHTDIWINPSNLYIWGFSNEQGVTYQFSDIGNALQSRIRETTAPAPPVNHNVQTLNIGSNYNSLSNAAGRGREAMPISWIDMRYSIVQLAGESNPWGNRQATARSLSLMIQALSEAARFNDVEGTFRAAMNNWEVRDLPIQQQYLENSWDALSRYYSRVSSGQNTTPVDIPTVGQIGNLDQVRRYVRLTMGHPHTDNGDWSTDQI
ncbi:ribosome-inactivating family protein [Kitasatospora sp. NPDC057500]|uniref:ribosome-inactivating family protein n=1 Tax=Kitasatospora sp. NPDC057500 TaxID=3346151 RepID=UPI00368E8B14